MDTSKEKFIECLLGNQKLKPDQALQVLKLAAREMSIEVSSKIDHRLFAFEKRLLEAISDGPKANSGTNEGKARHLSIHTSEFLAKFSQSGGPLHSLIHTPDEDWNLFELIKKAKAEVRAYENKINPKLYEEVGYLIERMERRGVPFWQETGNWPFGKDGENEYWKSATKFKKDIRFGPAETHLDDYTSLQSVIKGIVDEKLRVMKPMLHFVNNSDRKHARDLEFDQIADFATYVPYIRSGLAEIFGKYLGRSNDNGEKEILGKEILISVRRNSGGVKNLEYIELRICDVGSVSEREPDAIRRKFQQSKANSDFFRSLCDWDIEYSVGGKMYLIPMLLDASSFLESKENYSIKEIESNFGFTHVLKFYQP